MTRVAVCREWAWSGGISLGLLLPSRVGDAEPLPLRIYHPGQRLSWCRRLLQPHPGGPRCDLGRPYRRRVFQKIQMEYHEGVREEPRGLHSAGLHASGGTCTRSSVRSRIPILARMFE